MSDYQRYCGILTSSFFGLVLTACASGTLTVQDVAAERPRVSSIKVVHADATVAVDPEVEQEFEKDLREKLYAKAAFVEGDELTLSWRFIQLNKGS